jgi:hypothetical protein
VFLYHVCCDVSDTSRTRDFEDDIDAKQINLPTPPLLEIAEILNAQFHSRFAPEFKRLQTILGKRSHSLQENLSIYPVDEEGAIVSSSRPERCFSALIRRCLSLAKSCQSPALEVSLSQSIRKRLNWSSSFAISSSLTNASIS